MLLNRLSRLSLLVSTLALFAPACKSNANLSARGGARATPVQAATGSVAPVPVASMRVSSISSAPLDEGELSGVNFSHDDVDEALARAKKAGQLVFVDAWAQWCHTCLSMDAYVLRDPRLAEFQDRVQFVALDTDKPVNAKFLERFAMHTWPTFFIIDPTDGKLMGLWPGAASVSEMHTFLRQSVEAAEALGKGRQSPPLAALVKAREAHAGGDYRGAATAYEGALHSAPPGWPQFSEVLIGYSHSLLKLRRYDDCAELGVQHLDALSGAARPMEFAQRAYTCIRKTKRDDRAVQLKRVVQKMRDVAYSAGKSMSADDRADALNIYARVLTKSGDRQGAKAAHADRFKVIEAAAAAARTPREARAFDRLRALSLVGLGREQEAFEFLRKRQQQFPTSYEPFAILADVYAQLGHEQETVRAFSRAVELSEGERMCRFLSKLAVLHERLKEPVKQRAVLEREIAERKKLSGAAGDLRALRRAEAALRRIPR